MPNIGLLSTVTALAQAYCSNGRNQEQAMVEVGYSKAYARSYCGKLWADKRLIDAIERIDAKTAKELDHNRAIAIGLLTEALAIARLKNDNQGIVSATRELNAISGLHSKHEPVYHRHSQALWHGQGRIRR